MSLEDLEIDVTVIGTGITEAIVAGALSRAGKKVLHLDINDFYGSQYTTFNLKQFKSWAEESQEKAIEGQMPDAPPAGYEFLPLSFKTSFDNFRISESGYEQISSDFRSYNIDLFPRVLLSSGDAVNLLIRSGVSRYVDFRAFESFLIYSNQISSFEKVPCTKGEVFQSKALSPLEKRQLMKFLQSCMARAEAITVPESVDPFVDWLDRPFVDFLTEKGGLSQKLRSHVLYSMALAACDQDNGPARTLSTKDALTTLSLMLSSLGRFGTTPFLTPFYGVSEIAQAFCRVSAVYGGTYILRKCPLALTLCAQTPSSDQKENQKSLIGLYFQPEEENHSHAISTTTSTPPESSENPTKDTQSSVENAQNKTEFLEEENSAEKKEKKVLPKGVVGCERVVIGADYLNGHCVADESTRVSRAILVTNKSLFEETISAQEDQQPEGEESTAPGPTTKPLGIVFAVVPPKAISEEQTQPVQIVQYDHSSNMCPKGKYLVHLTSPSTPANFSSLNAVIDHLFTKTSSPQSAESKNENEKEERKPEALWSVMWQHCQRKANLPFEVVSGAESAPALTITQDVDGHDIHFDSAVKEAEKIVKQILGQSLEGDEFFLPIKNPDDEVVSDEL